MASIGLRSIAHPDSPIPSAAMYVPHILRNIVHVTNETGDPRWIASSGIIYDLFMSVPWVKLGPLTRKL